MKDASSRTAAGGRATASAGAADPVDQARAWLAAQTGQPVPSPLAPEPPAPPSRLPKSGIAPSGAGEDRFPQSGVSGSLGSGSAIGAHSAEPAELAGRPEPAGSSRRAAQSRPGGADADPGEDADPEHVARTIALRKLAAQARTRHELDQALRTKNVPDEAAAAVLDRLEEVGLVDDQAFAQDWVASRQQRRYLSRAALRSELQAKGIEREHLDAALATVDNDDELEAARALANKKAVAMRGLEPTVRDRRVAGALARRGFGSGIIATVLSELRPC